MDDYDNHATRTIGWVILALIVALGLAATCAHAADIAVTWSHPTQNTDGTAIPATGPGSIASTRVEWGSCAGTAFGTKTGEQVITAPATTTTITGLAPATWCVQVFSRNTYGAESTASGVVSRVIAVPVPRPPTIVSALVAGQIDVPVFKFNADGVRSTAVAGFVKAGTECVGDPVFTYRGKTYRRVAQEDVRWWQTTKSPDVAAPCIGA